MELLEEAFSNTTNTCFSEISASFSALKHHRNKSLYPAYQLLQPKTSSLSPLYLYGARARLSDLLLFKTRLPWLSSMYMALDNPAPASKNHQ